MSHEKGEKSKGRNKAPRILIATGVYPPEDGGPATYSKLLADELPARGFHVEVVPFRIVRYLPKVIRHIAYFFALVRYARAEKADIIFAQDPVSVGLPALVAARLLRKKFLLKIVGDYAWEQGVQRCGVKESLDEFTGRTHDAQGRRYPALVLFLKNIETHVANHADRIIVPSQYLRKIVTAWGVSAEKISVIYNSFEAPKDAAESATEGFSKSESKADARGRLGIADKTIISVARLVPWKGLSLLIALMPKIRAEFPGTRLLIAGSGPQERELKALAATSGGAVEFLGQLPHDRLLAYIKAADLFVLNTAYEGLSHLLLEAMALGTPIITTPVGGNVELIRNGEEGALVQYNDRIELERAIKRLLGDPLCARGYAERAQAKVEADFGKERLLGELERVLHDMVSSG